jgi:agmatinase
MTFDPGAAATPDSGIFGLTTTVEESAVVVVPVPFEATTSYGGGTSKGPRAVWEASKQVDLFDFSTGRPYEAGICMLDESPEIVRLNKKAMRHARKIIGVGGRIEGDVGLAARLEKVNRAGDRVNQIVYETVRSLLEKGKIVVTLGGDHSAPFGAIQAYSESFPGLGILHVDAHADLRPAYEGFTWSHASIFYNVVERLPGVAKLVQVGIRDFSEEEMEIARATAGRVRIHHDEALVTRKFAGEPWARIVADVVADLPEQVYVSFDIDGFDPALCPHTGTPVPGGLSWHEAVALISGLVTSGRRIVGMDLCEVAPGAEGDEWDANVGARILYKMIGFALKSRSGTPDAST